MRQPAPKLRGHQERPFAGNACLWVHSEKPLVLVLEDLHWVDLSTVDLISTVARPARSPQVDADWHVSPRRRDGYAASVEGSQTGPADASHV